MMTEWPLLMAATLEFNITQFYTDFWGFFFNPYTSVLGHLFWPGTFTVLIGYVYVRGGNSISLLTIIVVFFSLYGSAFYEYPDLMFIYVAIAALALTALGYKLLVEGK